MTTPQHDCKKDGHIPAYYSGNQSADRPGRCGACLVIKRKPEWDQIERERLAAQEPQWKPGDPIPEGMEVYWEPTVRDRNSDAIMATEEFPNRYLDAKRAIRPRRAQEPKTAVECGHAIIIGERGGYRHCHDCGAIIETPQEPDEVLSREDATTLLRSNGRSWPDDVRQVLIPLLQRVAREWYARGLETPTPQS